MHMKEMGQGDFRGKALALLLAFVPLLVAAHADRDLVSLQTPGQRAYFAMDRVARGDEIATFRKIMLEEREYE